MHKTFAATSPHRGEGVDYGVVDKVLAALRLGRGRGARGKKEKTHKSQSLEAGFFTSERSRGTVVTPRPPPAPSRLFSHQSRSGVDLISHGTTRSHSFRLGGAIFSFWDARSPGKNPIQMNNWSIQGSRFRPRTDRFRAATSTAGATLAESAPRGCVGPWARARDTPTSVGTSRPRSVSRPDRSRTTDAPSMMACARAGALAARAGEAPGCSGGPVARASRARGSASRGAGGAPARVRVAAGALAAAGPSTVAFATVGRRGFGAAGARGGAAVSAVAVTGGQPARSTRWTWTRSMSPSRRRMSSPQVRLRENPPRIFPSALDRRRVVGARRRDVARAPTPRKASAFPTAFTTPSHAQQARHRGSRPRTCPTSGSDARARNRRPFRARSLARDAREHRPSADPPARPPARQLRAVTPASKEIPPRANPPATEAPRRIFSHPVRRTCSARPSPPSAPPKSPTP